MSRLLETLATELERPRELSARVIGYIGGTYGIDHEAIGTFLVEELPALEDYEIDLILSPVFTPKLADQAVFAELLGRESVPRAQWPMLIQQLVTRPVRARLFTPGSPVHSVALREVTVERYVHRLRLEAGISEPLFRLIEQAPSWEDRPLLKAIARRAVWESDGSREILRRYLTAATSLSSLALADVAELLNLMEARKPSNVEDLQSGIPLWQEALRQQIEVASGPKPFFNQEVQALHGGGRDHRGQDDARVSAKQKELEFLGRLRKVFIG